LIFIIAKVMKKSSVLFAVLLFCLNPSLPAQVPEDAGFLVSAQKTTIEEEIDAVSNRTCTTVYSDGSFRYERVTQSLASLDRADFKVYKGQLTPSQLQELKMLLQDTNIAAAPEFKGGKGVTFTAGEFLDVFIRREDRLQHLFFRSAFGILQGRRAYESVGAYNPVLDDQSMIKPLLKFLSGTVEKNKGKSLKGTPAQCTPPAGGDKLKKPPISS
jgi:hypothetical protein